MQEGRRAEEESRGGEEKRRDDRAEQRVKHADNKAAYGDMRSFSHRCASRSMSITLGVSSTVRCHTTAFVHAAVSKGLGLISLWHLKVCVPRCMHYASISIAFSFILRAFSSIFIDF